MSTILVKELQAIYSRQKSFYGHAYYTETYTGDAVVRVLYSYNTAVCEVVEYDLDNEYTDYCLIPWSIVRNGKTITKSATTTRHIKEFLNQFHNGFIPERI